MEDKPNHRLIAEYLRKSFFSVDGLWFMKTEEDTSFEKALEIDIAVWRILPKIQARTLKHLLALGDGFDDFKQALGFKLHAEGFNFETVDGHHTDFLIRISLCPWAELIHKSGRGGLVKKISDAICPVEFDVFSKEFGGHIRFERKQKGCEEADCCLLLFSNPAAAVK